MNNLGIMKKRLRLIIFAKNLSANKLFRSMYSKEFVPGTTTEITFVLIGKPYQIVIRELEGSREPTIIIYKGHPINLLLENEHLRNKLVSIEDDLEELPKVLQELIMYNLDVFK